MRVPLLISGPRGQGYQVAVGLDGTASGHDHAELMERVRTFASSRARSGKGRLVYLVHGESGGIVVLSAREYESVRGDELASQFEVCDLLSGAEALAQRIRRRT